jgi:hypothetical protein
MPKIMLRLLEGKFLGMQLLDTDPSYGDWARLLGQFIANRAIDRERESGDAHSPRRE